MTFGKSVIPEGIFYKLFGLNRSREIKMLQYKELLAHCPLLLKQFLSYSSFSNCRNGQDDLCIKVTVYATDFFFRHFICVPEL